MPDAATVALDSIEASSDTVAIPPFGSRLLTFQAHGPDGVAAPGAIMNFSIVDDPASLGSGGARLSFSSALTDDNGRVTLQVIAGTGAPDRKPLKFKVEASAGSVRPLSIPIFVTTGVLAGVEIVPIFTGVSPAANTATATNIYFYDDSSCDKVNLAHPAVPMRGVRILPRDDPTFTSVVTSGIHAILGVAVDGNGKVVAQGCTNLFGSSLSSEQLMRVQLPLEWIYPSPEGTFHAVSQFSFTTALPGTISAQDRWKNLSADICDPARLWLDCTIVALDSPDAGIPIDCQAVPGNQGPLAARLTARRTTTGPSSSCASQVDDSGKPSLDAEVYALFPPGALDAMRLKKLPDEIGSSLTRLTVGSTLAVAALSSPNAFGIVHELTDLELPDAAVHSPMTMTSLAAPVLKAPFVTGVSRAGQLMISQPPSSPHGFTLELGSAARFTFAASSLAPRLGIAVADVRSFIEALVKLATSNENGTKLEGCDALDALLCSEAGQKPGCARTACLAGLDALIQQMDSSFAGLDGLDLDFHLSGWAPIVDRDGDGHAEALGSSTGAGPGIWSGVFKTRTVVGSWTAERASASGQ